MAARSRKFAPRIHRNPASASSSASEESDDTTETLVSASYVENLEKAVRLERLVKEYLKIQARIVQLEARKHLGRLRPSRVEKARHDMTIAALTLHAAAKNAQSQQSEGSDIVVSSKECAKDCMSMTSLLHDLTSSQNLERNLDEGLTWTGFDLKELQEKEERLCQVADTIDADVEQLQQRIKRLQH
ncbi:uncharacterized protein LOC119399947 isoform X1 [Rhipicephalus sanguineus]|uniref:uncharacterized protein LOC119399947 isoform X1 n=1 Tax=Rhipicephalus sanguineus TaxID=34632 RepID=UPI0018956934|nr:uncharacterized protein LOC119399947 isoform X1 [Rhipicephalus sanguineus]